MARRSYGKLVAFLAARTGDVAGAEDALSEAFAAALVDWPASGIPESPEAWLMAVARRRMIDAARRRRSGEDAAGHLQLIAEELEAAAASETRFPTTACADVRLRASGDRCGVRAPLILQTILGFDAATIASAFLVSPATMGQRLVRAKSKIRQAGIPFRVPERADLRERLDAVLEAIYAAFAEGWSDPAGTEIRRRNLAEEGIWLGRLVASLLPDEPEALGLLALMLHAEARRGARRDAAATTCRWPSRTRRCGTRADRRGRGAAAPRQPDGRHRPLPAGGGGAIGPCRAPAHRPRRLGGDRAALRRAGGDDRLAGGGDQPRGRGRRDARRRCRALRRSTRSPTIRGSPTISPIGRRAPDLLARTGAVEAADQAYERAIGLEADPAVRRFLQQRRTRRPRPRAIGVRRFFFFSCF